MPDFLTNNYLSQPNSGITQKYSQYPQFVTPNSGNRHQSTEPKGLGYFGELSRPDGRTSTELSVDVTMDGKNHQFPLLVPTLSLDEINHLLSGKQATPQILDKAIRHYMARGMQAKPAFAHPWETQPLPNGIK